MRQASIEQTELKFLLPKSPVESAEELIEILLQVPRRNAMKGFINRLLHVADHNMHQG